MSHEDAGDALALIYLGLPSPPSRDPEYGLPNGAVPPMRSA